MQRRNGVEDRVVLELGEPLAAFDKDIMQPVAAEREESGVPGGRAPVSIFSDNSEVSA